jgi:hypothetical protein
VDRYDEAIAYLSQFEGEEFKERVYKAWNYPFEDGGCLFAYCSDDGEDRAYKLCGCLTQVKCGMYEAQDSDLTIAIRNDARIPYEPEKIDEPADLEVFAEWQRKMDALWPGRAEKVVR